MIRYPRSQGEIGEQIHDDDRDDRPAPRGEFGAQEDRTPFAEKAGNQDNKDAVGRILVWAEGLDP